MVRLTSTHAAPGRPRLTRWPVARVKARLLGILIGIFEMDRVPRPVVYDVWPDLFTPREGGRPRSLNAAFRSDGPLPVCGPLCDPDHPSYQPCPSDAHTTTEAVSETC